jgi:hypothetical protein
MKRFTIILVFAFIASVHVSFSQSITAPPAIKGTNSGSSNYGYLGGQYYGVYGSNSSGGYGYIGSESEGVYGYSFSGYGVYGNSPFGDGVYGESITGYGVWGYSSSSYGVYGTNNHGGYGYLGSTNYGVFGFHSSSGNYGYLGSNTFGVYGYSSSSFAGYFEGNVKITRHLCFGISTDPYDTYGITLPNSSTATDFSGCGIAYGWRIYSDNRIKTNQQPLSYGLNEIMQLKPKEYEQHSSKTVDNKLSILGEHAKSIGLIAQELHEVIPEAAFPPANEEKDLWGVDLTKLVPVLIKAMQEQQTQIEEQQTINKEQQTQIENLQSQINQLMNEIKAMKNDCDKPTINVK